MLGLLLYIDPSPVHANGCPVITGAWASGDYSSSTGYVKAFNPTTGADAWRYPAGTGTIGGIASTPCVADVGGVKRVYFGSMDGKVYCLDALTGAFVWDYQTHDSNNGNGKVLASPVVYDGRVYIGNESATVYCLNASTGALIWSYTFQRDSSWPDRTGVSSMSIGIAADGVMRAYVGCDNGHVYCLSIADSPAERVIWDYAGEDGTGIGCVESSPTVYAGNVYVGTSWYEGTDLISLDAANGQPIWHQDLSEEVRATCAAIDNYVFIGVDTGHEFFRLSSATGVKNPPSVPPYTNPFDATIHRPESPCLSGSSDYFVGSAGLTSAGLCIVGNDNYALYALSNADLSLGSLRPTEGIVCSSPAISYIEDQEHLYRLVFVVSRANGGKLIAYKQEL